MLQRQTWQESKQTKSSRGRTITIFDWDDTLLPTSFLQSQPGGLGCRAPLAGDAADLLPRIEVAARQLLTKAIAQGQTFVVTNATSGWVEESAERYLPSVAPLLKQVTVLSARSTFEARYPGKAERWKVQAFLQIARECDFQSVRDVVVVGDGQPEMYAADAVGSIFTDLQVKAVKLKEEPSAHDLLNQLQLVLCNFAEFVSRDTSLFITLERSLKQSL